MEAALSLCLRSLLLFVDLLGHLVGFIITLSGSGDLCDLNVIVPGWNHIRVLKGPGVKDIPLRNLSEYAIGLTSLLCCLSFFCSPKNFQSDIQKFYQDYFSPIGLPQFTRHAVGEHVNYPKEVKY